MFIWMLTAIDLAEHAMASLLYFEYDIKEGKHDENG